MAKDLHLYASGNDPYTFEWDDVTFHIHAGYPPRPPGSGPPTRGHGHAETDWTGKVTPPHPPDPSVAPPGESPTEPREPRLPIIRRVTDIQPLPLQKALLADPNREIYLSMPSRRIAAGIQPLVEGMRVAGEDMTVHLAADYRSAPGG